MEIFVNLILGSVVVGLCVGERLKTRRQDRDLSDFYVKHMEEILAEEQVDNLVLVGVFERLAEFGAEVDTRMRRMEERLAAQERNLRALATENRRVQRDVRWSSVPEVDVRR